MFSAASLRKVATELLLRRINESKYVLRRKSNSVRTRLATQNRAFEGESATLAYTATISIGTLE
jgi:hypothetical protein